MTELALYERRVRGVCLFNYGMCHGCAYVVSQLNLCGRP